MLSGRLNQIEVRIGCHAGALRGVWFHIAGWLLTKIQGQNQITTFQFRGAVSCSWTNYMK
jgi:hypothetical protein